MKKPTTPLALSLLAALITLSQASATIIAQDDFTYSDGALAGNGTAADGWNEAWRNTSGGALVTSGVVTSDGGRTMRNLDLTSIATSLGHTLGADGTSVFIGIDNEIGNLFSAVEFHNGGDGDGARNFYLGQNGGTGGLYTKADGNTTAAVASSSTAAARYVIEINYLAGNDTAELFRDGISQGTIAGTVAGDLSFDRISFAAFVGSTTLLATDNLRIATTYAEAFAIPEPGTYALLAGLTGLVFVMLRRRR
jgi:hypothetical protein